LYEVLFQYLQTEKPLSLPGLGVLQLKRIAAQVDIADKKIIPPSYNFQFSTEVGDSAMLPHWIKQEYQADADKLINEVEGLLKGINQKIDSGDSFIWKGVGKMYKKDGKVIFDTESFNQMSAGSVSAEKIIREFAEHKVRVGEEEKTSTEMTELLTKKKHKSSYELIAATVVLGFSLSFLGWSYYQNAYSLTCFSSKTKTQVINSFSTYKNLP
jgi:hypothetical protein